MVAFGRALMTNPAVLLLDEPSEGLAPIIVDSLAVVIASLRSSSIAILLCEQNVRLAGELADRCYVLEKGRICWAGSASETRATEEWKSYLTV